MTNTAQLHWRRLPETFDGALVDRRQTYCAEVPGGWLVMVCTGKPGKGDAGGVAFIADDTHTWRLPEPPSHIEGGEIEKRRRGLGKDKRKRKRRK